MSDERVPSLPPPPQQRLLSRPPNVRPLTEAEMNPEDDRTALRLIVRLTSPHLFTEPANPAEVVKQCQALASHRLCSADSAVVAKMELLEYLIGIAQDSEGSSVWRALFAEIRAKYQAELDLEDAT